MLTHLHSRWFICFPKLRFSDQRKTPQWQTGLCPNKENPGNIIFPGFDIFVEIVSLETANYRLRNWEGLILLVSWNVVLQTRYKRRASHYFSEHHRTMTNPNLILNIYLLYQEKL